MSTECASVRSLHDSSTTGDWKRWEGQWVQGRFPLRQFLGGSEHSAVFLTTHREGAGQDAAIKLTAPDPEEAELQLARWRRAAALSHPHLIRLFEMGRCKLGDRQLLYLVMEYASENLAQILPQRPLTPAEAEEMLPPVLDALGFLHGQGLAHNHVTPANIMVVGDQVKISSDGIGAVGEATDDPGQPGAYDAPEPTRTRKLPARDVWSLGVTLVEALTQQKPTGENEPALLESLPPTFCEIARNCLLRDPQSRWSVDEIASRLRPAASAKPQLGAVPSKAPPRRRHLVPMLLAGLAVAAIALGPRLLRHPTPAAAGQLGSESPGGVVPGEVVHPVVPGIPQKASDTIEGTVRVRVRVQVSPAGDVTGAEFDTPGPSRYFARLAIQAAREWKFKPPTINGRSVASEWVLRFEFAQTGTKAAVARSLR